MGCASSPSSLSRVQVVVALHPQLAGTGKGGIGYIPAVGQGGLAVFPQLFHKRLAYSARLGHASDFTDKNAADLGRNPGDLRENQRTATNGGNHEHTAGHRVPV